MALTSFNFGFAFCCSSHQHRFGHIYFITIYPLDYLFLSSMCLCFFEIIPNREKPILLLGPRSFSYGNNHWFLLFINQQNFCSNFTNNSVDFLFFSIFVLGAAYFIQYILGYKPCNLCLIERLPYIFKIMST